jgi:hypothetical protein
MIEASIPRKPRDVEVLEKLAFGTRGAELTSNRVL